MKRYIMVETTQWETPTPNHTYIFSEKPTGRVAKCIAYVKEGTKDLTKFKNPYSLDLKGRTFKELTA